MRITQKYTDRTYLKYNNMLLENQTKSMEKIWRQKAYKRASEDSINASKAMIVRRNLRNLDVYDSNLKTADGLFKAAESNLYTLTSRVYLTVQNRLETGCNGTYDEEVDLNILATEIEQQADAAINVLNKDYAERTMFGGTNNSQPPFGKTTDEVTGLTVVTYNGVALNDIISDDKYMVKCSKADYDAAAGDGSIIRKAYDDNYALEISEADYNKYANELLDDGVTDNPDYDADIVFTKVTETEISEKEYKKYAEEFLEDGTANPDYAPDKVKQDDEGKYYSLETKYYQRQYQYYESEPEDLPGAKPIYVDIGIGIKYTDKYEVDPQTALDVSLNGAAITGYGTSKADGVTYSKNFVQQIFDSAAAFRRGDVDFANATLDRLNEANIGILTEITTLGAKQNSIEFYLEKNDDYRASLKSRQNDVEGVDMNQEITNLEATQAAYDAILQMSSRILPNSIFDFMR